MFSFLNTKLHGAVIDELLRIHTARTFPHSGGNSAFPVADASTAGWTLPSLTLGEFSGVKESFSLHRSSDEFGVLYQHDLAFRISEMRGFPRACALCECACECMGIINVSRTHVSTYG